MVDLEQKQVFREGSKVAVMQAQTSSRAGSIPISGIFKSFYGTIDRGGLHSRVVVIQAQTRSGESANHKRSLEGYHFLIKFWSIP